LYCRLLQNRGCHNFARGRHEVNIVAWNL
jgi:hypothetical protein